jgi:hypothetical protein
MARAAATKMLKGVVDGSRRCLADVGSDGKRQSDETAQILRLRTQ